MTTNDLVTAVKPYIGGGNLASVNHRADRNASRLGVLVHDSGSHSWDHRLDGFAAKLGDQGISPFYYSYHGRGGLQYAPPDTSEYTIYESATMLSDLLSQCGYEELHLVGYGLGGQICVQLLYNERFDPFFSARIGSLCLIGSPVYWVGSDHLSAHLTRAANTGLWTTDATYTALFADLGHAIKRCVAFHCMRSRDGFARYTWTRLHRSSAEHSAEFSDFEVTLTGHYQLPWVAIMHPGIDVWMQLLGRGSELVTSHGTEQDSD
jgi:pimeloyl-ACP methyl ester carboxylesterase